MNYWMLTISEENLEVTRRRHWKQQGFTTRQRKKVDRMQSGDRILFYVKGPRHFSATATVTSSSFEESTLVWREDGTDETFPYRVSIRPSVVLPKTRGLEAYHIAPRLEYLKRWPSERWPLAFFPELHLLPRKDFELLEQEMRRAQGRKTKTETSGATRRTRDNS